MKATVTITDNDGKVIVRESFLEPIEEVSLPVACLTENMLELVPSKTSWFKFGVTEYMNSPIKMFLRGEKEDKK